MNTKHIPVITKSWLREPEFQTTIYTTTLGHNLKTPCSPTSTKRFAMQPYLSTTNGSGGSVTTQ